MVTEGNQNGARGVLPIPTVRPQVRGWAVGHPPSGFSGTALLVPLPRLRGKRNPAPRLTHIPHLALSVHLHVGPTPIGGGRSLCKEDD